MTLPAQTCQELIALACEQSAEVDTGPEEALDVGIDELSRPPHLIHNQDGFAQVRGIAVVQQC